MSKVRVITKKTHILEWDNGEKIELSCGDKISICLTDDGWLEGIVCLPPRMVPFTLAIKNDITGIVTIRWTYIKKIIVIGYAPDESLYHYNDWGEVGKDE